MRDEFNILFTSSGRRVSLIKKFKEVIQKENIIGHIITADFKGSVPTAYISDKHILVPKIRDENYLQALLDICRNENIHLLIPLIDTELLLLSENRHVFERYGVKVFVSGKELNQMATNKIKTYEFFNAHNISTPKVYSPCDMNENHFQFPLFIKPWDGSSSKGAIKINNERELNFFKDYISNSMIQEYITGKEYTVDAMVDSQGNIITVVPRLRIETRAGEVSKGMTKKDSKIIEASKKVIQSLPNPFGCLTLQCFKQDDGQIVFIEINPRFGGGVPLSIEAGANFPIWAIRTSQGQIFSEEDFSWQEDLIMLRYDEAVFELSVSS